MQRQDRISNIIKNRNITQLVHFTKKQNINSIIKNGLLSIEELKKRNLEYIYNDPERRDDWNYAISLSITNKNLFLFESFKRRQKLIDSDDKIEKLNEIFKPFVEDGIIGELGASIYTEEDGTLFNHSIIKN